jgi:hypothetical protein
MVLHRRDTGRADEKARRQTRGGELRAWASRKVAVVICEEWREIAPNHEKQICLSSLISVC